jgi:hypothetical protein
MGFYWHLFKKTYQADCKKCGGYVVILRHIKALKIKQSE